MTACKCPCDDRHGCDKKAVHPNVQLSRKVFKNAPKSLALCKPCRSSFYRIIVTGTPGFLENRDVVFGMLSAEWEAINLDITPIVVTTSKGLADVLAAEWALERSFVAEVHARTATNTGAQIKKTMLSYGASLCVSLGGLTSIAEHAKLAGIETHIHKIKDSS